MSDYVSRMLEIQAEHERTEAEDRRVYGGGFIDPSEGDRHRIERLERLLAEVLPMLTLDALSAEAREVLAEVESGDVHRLHRHLADDPLPAPTAADESGAGA